MTAGINHLPAVGLRAVVARRRFGLPGFIALLQYPR
jgi:hypothetical protein